MTSYAYIEGELLPLMMLWPLPEQWLTVMKPCPILVEALVAAMRSGTIIPPVLVRFGRHDDHFIVLNGLHRTAASLLLGFDMIPATVRYGGKRYERRVEL